MKTFQDDKPKLWYKQPAESSKRYYAFCIYRDMGAQERSLSKVAKELQTVKKPSKVRQLQRWSTEGNWVARCEAWDTEQEIICRKQNEKSIKEMKSRHANIALLGQAKVVQRLNLINPCLNPEDLTIPDAIRLLEVSTKLERLTLGEPDNVTKHIETPKKKFLSLDKMEEEEARIAGLEYQ